MPNFIIKTFLVLLLSFTATQYNTAFATDSSSVNTKAERNMIGKTYLWQKDIDSPNYDYIREFNWQYTFLPDNQVVVHQYHLKKTGRFAGTIGHARLHHYSWSFKGKHLVVQRSWAGEDVSFYKDHYYIVSDTGLTLVKTIKHNGKKSVEFDPAEESLDKFVKNANQVEAILKEWYDGQREPEYYWDTSAYAKEMIAEYPMNFIDFSE